MTYETGLEKLDGIGLSENWEKVEEAVEKVSADNIERIEGLKVVDCDP